MGDPENNSLDKPQVLSVLRARITGALRLGTVCQVQGAGEEGWSGQHAMSAVTTNACTRQGSTPMHPH